MFEQKGRFKDLPLPVIFWGQKDVKFKFYRFF